MPPPGLFVSGDIPMHGRPVWAERTDRLESDKVMVKVTELNLDPNYLIPLNSRHEFVVC